MELLDDCFHRDRVLANDRLGEPGELASADCLCDTPQAVASLLGT